MRLALNAARCSVTKRYFLGRALFRKIAILPEMRVTSEFRSLHVC